MKMGKKPYFLNIAPLLSGHEAELAVNIADMAESGCITHNAFIFTLNPEETLRSIKPQFWANFIPARLPMTGSTACSDPPKH